MLKIVIYIFSFLSVGSSFAQGQATDSGGTIADSMSPKWAFEADVYYYILPSQKNTSTFLAYADRGAIHFEGRYNYEDLNTGSFFAGYRFETGSKFVIGATPMIGLVIGNIDGIAPGLRLDLSWKKFDFYSETEYVIDFSGNENNYLYTWSELAISPFNNFRTGISANRTRLYQSSLDLQRAAFAQYSFWKLTAGAHYFNPFTDDSFVIVTLGITF